MTNISQQIEAILYLKGQPMTIDAITIVAECDRNLIEDGLVDLIADYAYRNSALEIVESDAGFALCLKSQFSDLVQKIIPTDLGRGTLRTLAAIALNNPISQADVIQIRGSSAYLQIQELVDQGFIQKHRDGRSYHLEITQKFHQYFEIDDLSKLDLLQN
ncbi:segregation and condensation protein B [Synechococcus sp. PCC 7502]|uniref:SMC-Scp complex subunit ScpB n=1 Tax=Synechococcus sp. PCC 7502 TaxID=1173263 RepID=UPI00029FEB04|nr:SMC-Scp complex subunit ScpB [Synechococcus sp. PCC 7502]AFY74039.1 segregation and condensation protein B [Synechococcus sp. PCC 7502]